MSSCAYGRGQCIALGEHSINVSHCDASQTSQTWGSESNLMKFMAGNGTESGIKEKPDNEDHLTLCHWKAINQASLSQRCSEKRAL